MSTIKKYPVRTEKRALEIFAQHNPSGLVPPKPVITSPLPPTPLEKKTSLPENMGYPDFEGVCPKPLTTAEYAQFQANFIARKVPAAVIIGSAGGCKSFHFRETDGKYYDQCVYIAGKMKQFQAFVTLREAINRADSEGTQHPPLIVDDVHNAFKDHERIEFLQQALSPRPLEIARRITYTSRAAGEQTTIWYKGPCLILGNELPRKISESQFSLFDRIAQFSYFPAMREIHDFLKGKWKRDDEVYKFIGDNIDLIRKPSARWYDRVANEKTVNPRAWHQQAIEWFIGFTAEEVKNTRRAQNDHEKLRIMAHIMRNKNGKTDLEVMDEYGALCKAQRLTGGSIADFKRVKARYYGKA